MLITDQNKTVNEIVQILIFGGTVSILDKEKHKRVQKKLREIKNNCGIVLSQMREQNN
jgi:hypothetical protein